MAFSNNILKKPNIMQQIQSSNHHFMLSGNEIPTVSEQPVKSLGRLYTEDLKDTNRVRELHDDLDDWLTRIDKCG